MIHAAAQTFISSVWLGALGLSIGVSTSVASWLSTTPPALAQVHTADPVCYFHSADGRQYDLTALCSDSDTSAPTNQENPAGTNPEPTPRTVEADQLSTSPALEDILRTLDDATRLLDAADSDS